MVDFDYRVRGHVVEFREIIALRRQLCRRFLISIDVCICSTRFLLITCSTYLGVSYLFHTRSVHLLPSSYWTATHIHEEHSQLEVALNQQHSFTGSHTTICSKLVQLTPRKGRNYADSQAFSQAGSQAYRYLGWRDRGVGVEFGLKVGLSE